MNFSFLSRYWSFYLIGAKNTILLALIAVLLGTAIGLGIAMCRISKNKLVRFAGTAYVEFIRGTPLLVQLFIIYYGLQAIGIRFPDVPFISKILGINFSDFMSGVITMGLNSAAYVCEIFRGGIMSIDGIKDVEPMTHCLDDFEYVLREDVAEESVAIEDLLRNSDETEDREIVVPKVVG